MAHPMRKLLARARDARERHRERRRPTGFGFALADSVDYLDGRWDELAAHATLFMSRRYLKVLEEAGPDNLSPRCALVFRGRTPVAAVAAQSVAISAARLPAGASGAAASGRERILVCGNLLSWGLHGVAFAPGEDRAALWAGVAEALYRLWRADGLLGDTDFVMVKDVPETEQTAALERSSYRPLDTEPNMVLPIAPGWRSFEDYLASLTSKCRKAAVKVRQEVEAGGCSIELLNDLAPHADRLHALYMQVHEAAALRLVTLPVGFFAALQTALGDDLRCSVIRRRDEIVGFVTTVRDGDTAVGYYVGFDRPSNAEVPLYFRLLHLAVADAIAFGCRRLSLGRTVLTPEAGLGARGEPVRVYVRHRVPALNLLVRALLQAVPHAEPPEQSRSR